ncbi:MAG TPA: hypothetical protein VK464_12425 [Symbiobacteriaceae bacterium]|nr:hypothetical protein [Symbiobacteriaceae bacterium]
MRNAHGSSARRSQRKAATTAAYSAMMLQPTWPRHATPLSR